MFLVIFSNFSIFFRLFYFFSNFSIFFKLFYFFQTFLLFFKLFHFFKLFRFYFSFCFLWYDEFFMMNINMAHSVLFCCVVLNLWLFCKHFYGVLFILCAETYLFSIEMYFLTLCRICLLRFVKIWLSAS